MLREARSVFKKRSGANFLLGWSRQTTRSFLRAQHASEQCLPIDLIGSNGDKVAGRKV